MSDDERDLDRDWKPNGRPQSTMARNFSALLEDAFQLDTSLDDLSQSVEQKKKVVSTHAQELEALEARLKQTEELLKQKQSVTASTLRRKGSGNSPHRRTPLGTAFSGAGENNGPTSPLARETPKGPNDENGFPTNERRNGGSLRSQGAPPRTPMEDGYAMVERGGPPAD